MALESVQVKSDGAYSAELHKGLKPQEIKDMNSIAIALPK